MTKSKEDAVSPVIGVILMVAVTVILAAVIAAFVFGMGSNVNSTKIVGITAARDATTATNIVLTYQGGTDSNKVVSFDVLVNGADPVAPGIDWAPLVGETVTVTGTDDLGKDKITVVGTFTDGKEQIVLDTFV